MSGVVPEEPARDRPDRPPPTGAEAGRERAAAPVPPVPATAPATGAADSATGESVPPGARPPQTAAAPGGPGSPVRAGPGEPAAAAERPQPELAQHKIRRTRTGGLWVAVTGAAVVLLLLLIFILQNGQQVEVSFFGADGHLPLGVAMLLSAVAGALLVALLGAARIVQLRMVARRHRSVDAGAGR